MGLSVKDFRGLPKRESKQNSRRPTQQIDGKSCRLSGALQVQLHLLDLRGQASCGRLSKDRGGERLLVYNMGPKYSRYLKRNTDC